MGSRRRNAFVLLFVLGLLIASGLVLTTKRTVLGLDLRGGVELVYKGKPTPQNPEVTASDVDRALEIIRERTDKLGVAEPEIARVGKDQIEVGLPDVQNADRAIQQVGTTAQLYMYDWEPNVIPADPNAENPAELPSGQNNPAEQPLTSLPDAVRLAAKQKPECKNNKCSAGDRYYLIGVSDPNNKLPAGIGRLLKTFVGTDLSKRTETVIAGPETDVKDLFAELPGEKKPPNAKVVKVPKGTLVVENERVRDEKSGRLPPRSWFVIHDRPEIRGTDIKNPKQDFEQNSQQPNVTFNFTGDGRNSFSSVTRRIAQRGQLNALPGEGADVSSHHFAVVLDNEIVSRPIINYDENPDGIDGRNGAQISGSFTIQESQDLAKFLEIGALPIDLKLISQTTVSATLGQQALDQGLRAGIGGLILVLLFLIFYYRLLGVIAGIGLLVYAALFYAMIELIPITMTLPGIAGLVLTIGVAADSNIVIFERIKEEARAGRSMSSAISAGYTKGIKTIIDANVITLLTAFILFMLATSGVKGFAFTLGVGTIVSLLTAVLFTQAILGMFGRTRLLSSRAMLGATEKGTRWHFNFVGASRWFFSMSGLILLVGAISFATLKLNFGIDFESGTRIQTSLEKSTDVEGLRSKLEPLGLGDAEIQKVNDPEFGRNVFQIQTNQLPPQDVGKVQKTLEKDFGVTEDGFDNSSIGPTFGEQVARSAVYAIFFSLLLICAYVSLRFEPKYAVPVIIAVFHDILITGGVYSLTEREVSSATIAAFLTILGYSLYDTVIVFDRIRENAPRLPRATFSQIVNKSMSEVLTRSLITGLSSVFIVGCLLVFGGETLKDFAFAMMVGIASGTYSSIFIAAPVLTAWKEREPAYRGRRARILEVQGTVPPFPEENVVARVGEEGEDVEPAEEREAPVPPPAPVAREPVAEAPKPREAPPAREVPTPGLDGGDGDPGQPTPSEPLVGTGAGKKQEEKRRRRQQKRRRKHGRHR